MAEQKLMERQTAVKVWIRNLANGSYVTNPGWEPNHVISGELRIGRANVMGVVVQKSDSKVLNYDYVILDDSTGRIMVRAFEDRRVLCDFQVGDLINIIGKPREYAGEVYLIPEIARKVEDPLWVEVRKRELEAMPIIEEKVAPAREAPIEDVETEDIVTPLDRLLSAIKGLDKGEGVEIEDVLSSVKGEDAEKMLRDLLMKGDIFEIRPGRIMVLE